MWHPSVYYGVQQPDREDLFVMKRNLGCSDGVGIKHRVDFLVPVIYTVILVP